MKTKMSDNNEEEDSSNGGDDGSEYKQDDEDDDDEEEVTKVELIKQLKEMEREKKNLESKLYLSEQENKKNKAASGTIGRRLRKTVKHVEKGDGNYYIKCTMCDKVHAFNDSTLAGINLTKADVQFLDDGIYVDVDGWLWVPKSFQKIGAYNSILRHMREEHNLDTDNDDNCPLMYLPGNNDKTLAQIVRMKQCWIAKGRDEGDFYGLL